MTGKFLLILLIFGAASFELPGIIKKKQWPEFAAYMIFFVFGLVITVAHHVYEVNFTIITDWFIFTLGDLL